MLIKKTTGAVNGTRLSKALSGLTAGAVDRRAFLRGSGMAAGGLAALSALGGDGMVKKAEAVTSAPGDVTQVKTVWLRL